MPGLYAGGLSSKDADSFFLNRFSDIKGVEVTGRLVAESRSQGPLVQLRGSVKITGREDVRGTVTVTGALLSGRLGGMPLSR